MNEENPYQSPGARSEPIKTHRSYSNDSTYYRTPGTFWVAWGCMVTLCAVPLIGVFWLDEAIISPSIAGLLLSIFIAFRCQLCERYQHRCMTYGGMRIFFQCFVVCIGFGYLASGVAFGLYAFLAPVLRGSNVAAREGLYGLEKLPAFVAASFAVAAYLKLIQMSARRPAIVVPSQGADPTQKASDSMR
ncbi:MAG: hypothetical protein ACK5PZ_08230 [Pirellula sp.]